MFRKLMKSSAKAEDRLMQEFDFEVVSVNSTGEICERSTHTAKQFTARLNGSVFLEMVEIPEGTFLMGSRIGQGFDDERPQHYARVPSFFMSKYPITQEQWGAVMGKLPPCRCEGAKRPVDRVSWNDAEAFCARLSRKLAGAYRLPSEVEWEYACRAGSKTPFYFGETITTDLANYVGEHTYGLEPKGVYRHGTTNVGEFPPNAFGLYDMHGNVWEWCADEWHDNYEGMPKDTRVWQSKNATYHVMRGGCWHDPPDLCRCAARLRQKATDGEDYFGFRVALSKIQTGVQGAAARG